MNLRKQGEIGEQIAEMYLKKQGAKTLERNYRKPIGEIDLIMKMDGATVFVEVKQRSTDRKGSPGMAVDHSKQMRISKVALFYLKENKLLDSKVRFDVVEILDNEIKHIKGAFPFVSQ